MWAKLGREFYGDGMEMHLFADKYERVHMFAVTWDDLPQHVVDAIDKMIDMKCSN